MNYKFNLTYLAVIAINLLFGLNPQIKNELPISIYINPEEYISVDSLLEFEKLSYNIENPTEKSKYHFIIAHLLNIKLIELDVKTDNIVGKISDLINSYEEKLLKEHF